jgi:hypothetical protein
MPTVDTAHLMLLYEWSIYYPGCDPILENKYTRTHLKGLASIKEKALTPWSRLCPCLKDIKILEGIKPRKNGRIIIFKYRGGRRTGISTQMRR